MAQARGKSGSRRKSGKRSGTRSGSPLWPWIAALVVVGGGLAAYENSAAARRFIAGLTAEKPIRVATKPEKPAPPKSVGNGPWRQGPPKPNTPPDGSRTAAIVPPAPVGKPALMGPGGSSGPRRADEKLAGAYEAKFYLCGTAKQDDCVVSADRFVFHGQKIRLVGIEVPDIKRARCESERIKASDAELRVRAFLDSGPFELVTWDGNTSEVDGHKLREVKRNGMSLADILVREGLAKRPGGGKGGWC